MNFYNATSWGVQVGALESSGAATTKGKASISPNPTFRLETCRNVPEEHEKDMGTC